MVQAEQSGMYRYFTMRIVQVIKEGNRMHQSPTPCRPFHPLTLPSLLTPFMHQSRHGDCGASSFDS